MKTSQLYVFPDKQYAETDKPVTIEQPGSVINSVGLRAFMDTGKVELLSQARGTYEANETKK